MNDILIAEKIISYIFQEEFIMNLKTGRGKVTALLIAALTWVNCFGFGAASAAGVSAELAVFSYPTSTTVVPVAGDDLDNYGYGNKTDGYIAARGMFGSTARLFGSVDGSSYRKLEWSKADYDYNGSETAIVPLITGNTNNPWGSSPYFLVKCPTSGYDNITFSARVSGTKKGPANYKLQYSTDGASYTDVVTAASITDNKNLTDNMIFNNTALPAAAADKSAVYFRIIAYNTAMIGGGSFEGVTGGEAAINDVVISGTPKSGETPVLPAVTSDTADGSEIYSDTAVALDGGVSGASVYYTINGGAAQLYTEPFAPFADTDAVNAEIKAWSVMEGYEGSSEVSFTYTCTKDNITSFSFVQSGDMKYINGSVRATSGVYPTGRLTASLDGYNRFVPLYDEERGPAAQIAPDDTYTWHSGGYWQFELNTTGYDTVYLSMNACSSKKGPASMSLKYSTDGVSFITLEQNRPLAVSSFGVYFDKYELPQAAANKDKVYIRLVTEEDKRADSTDTAKLFGNESKGNTYINNVVFSGNRSSVLKTPYTTKKTDYFGLGGTIAYSSPDGADMRYSIYDIYNNAVVENAVYNAESEIALAALDEFDPELNNRFRVDIWAENGTEKSAVNSKLYTYKGDIITAFEYDETAVLEAGAVSAAATSGEAVLSMYPGGESAAELAYHLSSEALRVSASEDNAWSFDKTRKNPAGDGFWLIEASTKGYKDIVFTAEMTSTEKGPRDFCINYSTDGITYKSLENSSIRVKDSLGSGYSNITLPDELADRERIYIKIKLDGGESLSGAELDGSTAGAEDAPIKGNTGINNIEICGISLADKVIINSSDEQLVKGKSYNIAYTTKDGSEAVVTAAVYNNGRLVFCETGVSELVIPEAAEATDVKVMLWQSGVSRLIPITAAISKKIQQQ